MDRGHLQDLSVDVSIGNNNAYKRCQEYQRTLSEGCNIIDKGVRTRELQDKIGVAEEVVHCIVGDYGTFRKWSFLEEGWTGWTLKA